MRVNVIIPAFTTEDKTQDNVKRTFNQMYPGLIAEEVSWVKSECFVRVANLNKNFLSFLKQNQEILMLEKNIQNIKQDVLSFLKEGPKLRRGTQVAMSSKSAMESCNSVMNRESKKNLKVKKQETSQEKTIEREETLEVKQLLETISALTHQNISLKDTLSLYEVQLELVKNNPTNNNVS